MDVPPLPESFATMAENVLDPLLELVQGHRTRAEAAGFSPTAAETMAATLHQVLLVRMFTPNLGGSPCLTP